MNGPQMPRPGLLLLVALAGVLAGAGIGLWLAHPRVPQVPEPRRESQVPRLPATEQATRPTRPTELRTAPIAFDVQRAMGHVQHLAETIGCRPGGSLAERDAFGYAANQLAPLGWRPCFREGVSLGRTRRQTGYLVGRHPTGHGATKCVLGAHIDSIEGKERSPGGNDNGSGVAVLLESARCLVGESLPFELELVLFGAEETTMGAPGHMGSRAYVADALATGTIGTIEGLINVDMIGCGETLYAVSYDDPLPMQACDNKVKRQLVRTAGALGVPLNPNRNNRFGDHEPFARQGLPHVWLYRRQDPFYHTAQDTAARVQPALVEQAGRLVVQAVLDVARGHGGSTARVR